MMLVIGKGHLARALHRQWPDSSLVGRPEYDFSLQSACDQLVADHPDPTVIINTLGCITNDIWQNLTVNLLAPVYITAKYMHLADCHIINISSASSWWPSHPDLDIMRFSYNMAKESLSQFGRHINRITIDKPSSATVSTIEPGKFQSPMSNFTGFDVDHIVSCVQLILEKKIHHLSCVK